MARRAGLPRTPLRSHTWDVSPQLQVSPVYDFPAL